LGSFLTRGKGSENFFTRCTHEFKIISFFVSGFICHVLRLHDRGGDFLFRSGIPENGIFYDRGDFVSCGVFNRRESQRTYPPKNFQKKIPASRGAVMRVIKIMPSKVCVKRWIFVIIDDGGELIVFDSLALTQAKKLLSLGVNLLVQWDGKLWEFIPDTNLKDSVFLGRMIAEVA
jgi:hypothetical protein